MNRTSGGAWQKEGCCERVAVRAEWAIHAMGAGLAHRRGQRRPLAALGLGERVEDLGGDHEHLQECAEV